MILGVETKSTTEFFDFIEKTKERLTKQILLLNPEVAVFYHKDKQSMGLIYFKPFKIIDPFILSSIITVLLFFFFGWSYWLLIPGGLFIFSFLQTKYFVYLLLRLGARKGGHKHKIKMLTNDEIIYNLWLRG